MKERAIGLLVLLFFLSLVSLSGMVSAAFSANNSYYRYEDVLLVCNNASAESNEICAYFVQQRASLGMRNVLNLSGIATTENLECSAGYASLKRQVANYIANRTNDTINYIITTKGVPLTTCGKSLTSLLGCDLTSCSDYYGYGFGGRYYGAGVEDTFSRAKYGVYITTRLDGYTVQDVLNLIDRSGPLNRDSNALTQGKFIIDESNYAGYSTYFSRANTVLVSSGYNVDYLPSNTQPLYIRNETNVIGYVSWGGNDPDYSGNVNSLLSNRDFITWTNNTFPTNWNITSGLITRQNYTANPGYANSTSSGVINSSGTFRMEQVSPYNLVNQRKFYPFVYYAYNNFSGNAAVGFIGTNSSGYVFISTNMTFLSSSVNITSGQLTDASSLRYYPDGNVTNLTVYVMVNLVSGSFYLDEITLYEIAPRLNYLNGAIGTTAVSYSGRSFSNQTSYWRSSYGHTLIADLIQDGISGVEGFVYEPYLSAVAEPATLFDRYAKGYNLGDSFYMASSNLNWMDVIIGDPKTVIVTPGVSTAVSLNNVLDGERINNGTILNLSVSSNFNITNVSYSYSNGTFFGNITLNYVEGLPVYINTTNWTYGSYNITLYLVDFLNNQGIKRYSFLVNQTIGTTPKYNAFNGNTTDFKLVANRTGTNILLERVGAGKIDYSSKVLNVSGYNLDSFVLINYNNITIASENVSSLNTSATLTMYDLRFGSQPLIYRNGLLCNSTTSFNCTVNYYNSSSGELSFNVSGFSGYTSGVNANLSVWDDSDLTETKVNTGIGFYANYTQNVNGTSVPGANCLLIFSDASAGTAVYNTSSKLYEYYRNFTIGGRYTIDYNCSATGFETLYVSDTASISSCLRPTTSQDWNITTAQVCENVAFTMPQNKSINVLSGGNLTLVNTTINMNLSANGLAGINVSGSGIFDIQQSTITIAGSNYYSIFVNGSYFAMVNSSVSNAGWANIVGQRGLEIYSNLTRFDNNSLVNNYAAIIYSSNNFLYNIYTVSNRLYGIWLAGSGNTVQDSILANDAANLYSASSTNLILNTTNASSFSGSYTRKWYFRAQATDTNAVALEGVTATLLSNDYSYITDSLGYTNWTNVSEGAYTLQLSKTCYYTAQSVLNLNQSTTKTVQLTAISGCGGSSNPGGGGSSGGGGGGGSGSIGSFYTASESELSAGYTKFLGTSDKILFVLNNENHSVTVSNIGLDGATITAKSNPISVSLKVGESRKLSISSSGYYDLFIQLNAVKNKSAEVTVRKISEKIEQPTTGIVKITNPIEEKIISIIPTDKTSRGFVFSGIGLLLAALLLVLGFMIYEYIRILRERTPEIVHYHEGN